MRVGVGRGDAAAGSALQEAKLQQVGLDDVHDGVRLFADGGGNRLQTHRAAAKLADDGVEHATVEIVQAQLVYLQQIEGLQGDLAVDGPFGAHLGKVADT